MIYTVTFNPSLDYVITVEDFKMTMTNRTSSEQMCAGGKGINVSMVLKNLGVDSTALGFVAGFTGDEICRQLEENGCNTDFINISEGMSRINVKLKNSEGTEINGAGPDISREKLSELFDKLESLKEGDVLVLAGSIPPSLPKQIYSDIMQKLSVKNVMIIVDATNELLVNVLRHKPFLIKPNVHELEEIFDGIKIENKDNAIEYAGKLQEMGARNVLVSMAGDGAVFVDECGNAYKAEAPKGKLVNGVGAGDSMVAGFLAGYLEKHDYEYAFAMSISCGSASAFSENLATKEEVMEIYNRVIVEKV